MRLVEFIYRESVGCRAEQVSELRLPDFVTDQLDMIYAGPGRSVNCATQT